MLGMIGCGSRDQIENFDERGWTAIEAIVRSMTPAEHGCRSSADPVAPGSGTTVTEVNQLVQRLEAAREMMAQMGQMGGEHARHGCPAWSPGKAKQR